MVTRRTRRRGWIKGGTKAAAQLLPRKASPSISPALQRGCPAVSDASVCIFDIEGTLIDTAMPALNCWRETFSDFGFAFTTAELHRLSGLDRKTMVARLLRPNESDELGEFVLNKFQMRYRAEVLPSLRALSGAHTLLAKLKHRGARIALTTSADGEELAEYRRLLKVDDLVDACVCGDDMSPGEETDIVTLALDQLGMAPADQAIYVGDTPHDAEVARQARVRPVGLLSGHFARADLLGAGCVAVFLDPKGLSDAIVDEVDAAEMAPAA